MDKLTTILLGIPSGIVSAFIVWVSISLWHGKFTPWLRKQIYRGVHVNGEWTAVVMQDGEQNLVDDIQDALMTINYVLNIEQQNGHVVSGWFTQSVKNQNEETQGRYKAVGEIMDGVLVLSLSPAVKSKSTFGTLLVNVASAGAKLEGQFTFKGAKTNTIKSTEICLSKKL